VPVITRPASFSSRHIIRGPAISESCPSRSRRSANAIIGWTSPREPNGASRIFMSVVYATLFQCVHLNSSGVIYGVIYSMSVHRPHANADAKSFILGEDSSEFHRSHGPLDFCLWRFSEVAPAASDRCLRVPSGLSKAVQATFLSSGLNLCG
jgi:hypothetical protein